MSLEQIEEKIKPFLPILNKARRVAVIIAVISLIIAIFGIYSINARKEGIEVIYGDFQPKFAFLEEGNVLSPDTVVASKSGTKYYFSNCSRLNAIKLENRVYFDSEEEAKEEGLSLATNCKKSQK